MINDKHYIILAIYDTFSTLLLDKKSRSLNFDVEAYEFLHRKST